MPTISLALGERSYDIHVENGALDRTGEFAYRAGLDGKIAVITDSCVAPLYAERVMKSLESAGFMPSLHVVNAGEASKNMLQAQELCSELVRAGLDRTGCIGRSGRRRSRGSGRLHRFHLLPGHPLHANSNNGGRPGGQFRRRKDCRQYSRREKSCRSLSSAVRRGNRPYHAGDFGSTYAGGRFGGKPSSTQLSKTLPCFMN